jgi:putative protein-disulfide isomerase
MSDLSEPSEKKLLYIYDPLCGWCYGFSPVIQQLYDATKRRARWEILAGGMVVGERIGPIGRISEFIRHFLPRVEGTTGVHFGEAFTTEILDPGTLVLSSVEPSRALQAIKTLAPDRALAFASRLQRALYDEGRDVTNMGVLGDVAESVRVIGFELEYMKTETYDKTFEEFRRVSQMGITGFPTLVGVEGDETRVFSRGWTPFDRVFEGVNRWLES